MAISAYASLEWETDEAIAARYMIALILNNNPSAALLTYKALSSSARSPRTEAIYLFALYSSGDDSYKDALTQAVKIYSKTLESLFPIAYYVQDQTIAKTIVIPAMKDLINGTTLNTLYLYQKIELIAFFAHCGEVELLEVVLGSVSDLTKINTFTVGEIYRVLFYIVNCEYVSHSESFQKSDDFEAAERVADRFLKSEVYKKGFLQVKVLCSSAKKCLLVC